MFLLVTEGFSAVTVADLAKEGEVGRVGTKSKNKENHIGIDDIHIAL